MSTHQPYISEINMRLKILAQDLDSQIHIFEGGMGVIGDM